MIRWEYVNTFTPHGLWRVFAGEAREYIGTVYADGYSIVDGHLTNHGSVHLAAKHMQAYIRTFHHER